jgi:hypothetical protein
VFFFILSILTVSLNNTQPKRHANVSEGTAQVQCLAPLNRSCLESDWLVALCHYLSGFIAMPPLKSRERTLKQTHFTFLTRPSSSYVPELLHSMMFNSHNFKASLKEFKKLSRPVGKTNSFFRLYWTCMNMFCLHSTRLLTMGGREGNYSALHLGEGYSYIKNKGISYRNQKVRISYS